MRACQGKNARVVFSGGPALKPDYCRAIVDEINAEACVHADMPACGVQILKFPDPILDSPKGPPQLTTGYHAGMSACQ